METLDLGPYGHAEGTLRLPGSKSISNRVLLLAALSHGTTRVRDLLASDDTKVMLDALATLGVKCTQVGDSRDFIVEGCGGAFPVKTAKLFMGNAGTAIRPLTAALALSHGDYAVSGVARMHERPIGDLVDGLRQLGAHIDYVGNAGYPPLHIQPADVAAPSAPIRVRGDVSSQFLTALLLTLPLLPSATGEIVVEVEGELISKPYIDITLRLLRRFGIDVRQDGWSRFTLPAADAGGAKYRSPGEVRVEGDASSASYFLAAGAIGGGPLRVEGVGRDSIQGDVRFVDALAAMGARVTLFDDAIEVHGVDTPSGKLRSLDMDFNHIPDAAMTIAVAALFADGTTTLRNIASWRVKETDRLAAMAIELRKVGATVEEGTDYLRVTPPAALTPNAAIDTRQIRRSSEFQNSYAYNFLSEANADEKTLIIVDPGYSFDLMPSERAIFSRAKYIYSTIAHLTRIADIETVIAEARSNGTKLFIDVEAESFRSAEEDWWAFSSADFLSFNEESLGKFCGAKSAHVAIASILAATRGEVITTLGKDGCEIVTPVSTARVSGLHVGAVDPLGAGDTFNSSYLFGRLNNWSVERSARFANAAAARSTTMIGPRSGRASVATVEVFLQDVERETGAVAPA